MATEIYMPQLGLTMTDGTVVRWLKVSGELVAKGEPVLEIETDKVVAEVEAPTGGVLGPVLAQEGAVVPIGGLLTYVLMPGEEAPSVTGNTVAAIPSSLPSSPLVRDKQDLTPVPAGPAKLFVTPRARRLAYELGVDPGQVEASGPGDRVVEADIRWYADRAQVPARAEASPVARRLAERLGIDLAHVRGTGPGGRIVKEDVERETALPAPLPGELQPLTGIHRVMAERMTHSFTSTPHFYLSAEVEATALRRMRQGLLAKVEDAVGARLTITDILVKVCAQALSEFPNVNVAWAGDGEGGGLLRQSEVNVGVAVALEEGLVVPVIHHADQLTLAEIARRRTDLVTRARSGKSILRDLEGGTFTLTNLGTLGVDQFHAIINPPQSSILAVGRIRERPIALDGAAVVRPTMHLTLSVDHRVLDGAQGARFLERVSQLIEEPYLLLA